MVSPPKRLNRIDHGKIELPKELQKNRLERGVRVDTLNFVG